MVKQLLAFARKGVIQKKTVSLKELLNASKQMLKISATEKIRLNVEQCEEALFVDGDMVQLQQVLMNLVNNAQDALEGNQTPIIAISLDLFLPDESFKLKHSILNKRRYARLTVSDNGSGISPHDLEHIFEPFFTNKQVGKGTGLGLAMIDGTVASHGGIVEVESHLGEGTAFVIYLPLLDDAIESNDRVQTPHQKVNYRSRKEGIYVLLVDDERTLRETNHAVLESMGYQVYEASDGLQAIEQFTAYQDQIQLIIMDVVMPKMGGIAAAKRILEINPSVPILFATGYDSTQVLGDEAQGMKDCHVLTKPFTIQALDRSIKKLTA